MSRGATWRPPDHPDPINTANENDVLLERDALRLSQLWLDYQRNEAQAREEAEVLVAAAQARGDPHTAWLS